MEINEALGYLLNTGSRLIKRRMDACLVEFDLTSTQWSVLKLLQEKKLLTQARISEELLADRATVCSVVAKLDQKGFIQKSPSPEDRRAFTISLNDRAEKAVTAIESKAATIIRDALASIPDHEVQQLYKSLNRIIENLTGPFGP